MQIYKFVLKCTVCSFLWNIIWITQDSSVFNFLKFLTACTLLVESLVVRYEEKESLNTVLIEKLDTIYYILNPSIILYQKVYLRFIFLNRFKQAKSLIFLVIYKRNLWGFNFSLLRLASNVFNGKGPHFKTFTNKYSR